MESKLTWAQTTGMPAKAPAKSPYSYSKEVLLSYFSPSLPIPPALQEIPFVCSVETLVPLANLPLSEVEKKLIASGNLNAETKRGHHDKNRKSSRKESVKLLPGEELVSPNGSTQDLWDMPLGVGGFGSDGVFQDASKNQGGKFEKDIANDLLDKNLDQESLTIPFSTKSFHTSSPQEIEPVQRKIHADLTNQKLTQETPLLLNDSRSDMYVRAPMMPRIPPFNFNPQSWMYRDPSGNLQGPFSSQQMQDWYSEGFFPPDLPIKHVEDPGFVTIAGLVSRFGSKVPFLAELEDSHAMARLLYERRVASMVLSAQQDPLRFTGLGYAANNSSNISTSLHSEPAAAWRMPSAVGQRPAWDDKRHIEPSISTIAPLQRTEQPINNAVGSRPGVESIPVKPPPQQLGEKMESLHLSSAPTTSTVKPAKVVDPMALPPKPKPLSPTHSDKKRVEKTVKSEEVSPVKSPSTSMAPWAKAGAVSTSQGSNLPMKMKDIQEKEEKGRLLMEKERQRKAEEDVLAQATAILNSENRSVGIAKSEGPAWGSKVAKPVALNLSDIMVEENLQKNSMTDNSGHSIPSSTGGFKRYADLVNSSPGPVIKAIKPQSVPSNQIKNVVASKDVISSGGWQSVGKGGHIVHPAPEPKPAPVKPEPATPHAGIVLPAKPSATISPTNSAKSPKNTAASPEFTKWFFSALKGIPPSSGVKVNDFFYILQSISAKDKSFITNICDDTLGGIPSIDPRKFGEEYLRRRLIDEKSTLSTPANGNVVDESAFTVVTKKKKKNTVRE